MDNIQTTNYWEYTSMSFKVKQTTYSLRWGLGNVLKCTPPHKKIFFFKWKFCDFHGYFKTNLFKLVLFTYNIKCKNIKANSRGQL